MTDKIIRVKIDAGDSAAQINQLDKSMVGLGADADKAVSSLNSAGKTIQAFGVRLSEADIALGRFIDKNGRVHEATGQFVSGFLASGQAVKDFAAQVTAAGGVNTKLTETAKGVKDALGGTSQGLAGFGRQAGQAGIQLQQFVGQVQGGVSPLVALSQQAADLGYVLGFPLLGAVVGIAAAVGGPLISSFITAGDESDKLKDKLDDLQKKIADLDAESKKAFTQVELGKLNTEYDKQREKVDALRQEAARMNEELKNASGPAQERLAVRLTNTNQAIADGEKKLKDYSTQMDAVSKVINESLADGQNNAIDKTANLTQQLELQQIALKQGELAALLQAAAIQTGADSVENLDAKIKALIISNYELEQAQKAQKESQAALTAEINAEAAAWAKQGEQEQRNAERARRDQERIDQRLANMRLETQTMASEAALQKAVRDEVFTQEEADLAARTSARLLAATTEYQQLMELDNISNAQKIEAKIAYEEQIAAINAEYAQRGYDLEVSRQMMATETAQRIRDANLQAMSSGVSILETFLGRSNAIVKAARIAMGAYQAFSIYASSTAAAAAALAPPPLGLGPIAGAGLAASIKTAGSVSAAAVLASSVASTFSGGGGSASFGGGSIATSAPTLPTTPQAAAQVGSFEISGLSALTDELRRRDPDEQLPVAFVRRIVASLDSVQRLQGA